MDKLADEQRWTGLLLTILSAASALVSSVFAATAGGVVPRRAVLAIAIMASLTTVTSFGKTQLEEQKDIATREHSTLLAYRDEFLQASATVTPSGVAALIRQYRTKLESH